MRATCQKIFGREILPRYKLHWSGKTPEPELRMADDLHGIFAQRQCRARGPIYAMFRNLAKTPADRWWMKRNGLRYDITVIPPRVLCGEFVKTKGHYHPLNGNGHGFPEIYEVLEGRAHYLLQREDLSDAVLVGAAAGDIVVIPPGYGHVTINPTTDQILQMANIVSGRFSSDYTKYVDGKGAAYYVMADLSVVRNPAYARVPHLRRISARRIRTEKAGLTFPLYTLIEKRRPVLGFLNTPEEFSDLPAMAYP